MTKIACLALAATFASPAFADDAADRRAAKERAAELCKHMASKDVEERIAGVRGTAGVHHSSLVAPLAKLLKDKESRVRLEAIAALGMRDDPKNKKSAAKALVTRLKPLEGNEKTREELLKIVQALHDLAQTTSMKALVDLKADADRSVAGARAKAVGNVPSKEAVELLLQLAGKGRKRNSGRRAALAALSYATGEKIRGNLDGWRAWWKDNKATFDPEAAAEKRALKQVELADKEARRAKRKNKGGKGKKNKNK